VVRTIPNRARPWRRELLLRISSQEIRISGAVALTIGVGASRHWQRGFQEENRGSEGVTPRTSRREVERLERVKRGAAKW